MDDGCGPHRRSGPRRPRVPGTAGPPRSEKSRAADAKLDGRLIKLLFGVASLATISSPVSKRWLILLGTNGESISLQRRVRTNSEVRGPPTRDGKPTHRASRARWWRVGTVFRGRSSPRWGTSPGTCRNGKVRTELAERFFEFCGFTPSIPNAIHAAQDSLPCLTLASVEEKGGELSLRLPAAIPPARSPVVRSSSNCGSSIRMTGRQCAPTLPTCLSRLRVGTPFGEPGPPIRDQAIGILRTGTPTGARSGARARRCRRRGRCGQRGRLLSRPYPTIGRRCRFQLKAAAFSDFKAAAIPI